MQYLQKFFCLFVVLAGACSLVTPSQTAVQDGYDEVFFHINVKNLYGKRVTGLKKESFRIYENNVQRDIEHFASEDEPSTIGIIVDTSSSTRIFRWPRLAEALGTFVNRGNPENEYFLICFDEAQNIVLDITKDKQKTIESIKGLGAVKPAGETKIGDAITTGLAKLSKGSFRKKSLLLVSDAEGDFGSVSSIKGAIKKSDAIIYAVLITRTDFDISSFSRLRTVEDLVDMSGGETFYPKSSLQFNKIFSDVAENLRNGYVLGFHPTKKDPLKQ